MQKVYDLPVSILDNVRAGLDRSIADWRPMIGAPILNLGAGRKLIHKTIPLDATTGWIAPYLPDYGDNEVNGIYAYHFLEHLDKNTIIALLRECERVLCRGGLMNIAVPWAKAQIAFQDLDHKSFWTERTFKTLFENEHYQGATNYDNPDIRPWRLQVRSIFLFGLIERNIMVFAQLEKF